MNVKLKDGREVNIRPVTPEDKEGLFALFSTMSEEALRWNMAPYAPDRIQRWIENLPNLIFTAAVHGGRIVGQATVNKFTPQGGGGSRSSVSTCTKTTTTRASGPP